MLTVQSALSPSTSANRDSEQLVATRRSAAVHSSQSRPICLDAHRELPRITPAAGRPPPTPPPTRGSGHPTPGGAKTVEAIYLGVYFRGGLVVAGPGHPMEALTKGSPKHHE